jgi:hypothetical protein
MVWIIKSDNRYSVFHNHRLIINTVSQELAEWVAKKLLTYLKDTESELPS